MSAPLPRGFVRLKRLTDGLSSLVPAAAVYAYESALEADAGCVRVKVLGEESECGTFDEGIRVVGNLDEIQAALVAALGAQGGAS